MTQAPSNLPVSAYYDHYWTNGFFPAGETLDHSLAALLERFGGESILDVGCGDGARVGRWAKARERHYVGLDVSPAAVAMCERNGFEAQVIDDATHLPVNTDSVDTVVCMEVLEHLFMPSDAVTEMKRALKPGGAMVVTVPNVAHWRLRVDLAALGRWHPGGDDQSAAQPWRDPHIRFFTAATLAAMLTSQGLTVSHLGAVPTPALVRMPGLRRWATRPGRIDRALCARWPRFFGVHLAAVATK